MNTKKVRVRKQSNGTYLPTITKKQKSYESQFSNTFEWLPYILGNSVITGIVIYSNYSLHTEHGVSIKELAINLIICLSLGAILAYWIQPKESDEKDE
jgi:hypothetical protein